MKRTAKSKLDKEPSKSELEGTSALLEDVSHHLLEHRSAFQAFLRRRVADDAVAEDLLQQSLMRAVERHRDLQRTDSAVSWFYRILRNAVVDYYRSRAADSRKTQGLLEEMVTAGEDHIPSLDDARPTVCACLGDVVKDLRPGYADLIRRIDLQGEAPTKVARELNVTVNALTVRLHRARKALRMSLEDACGICTKHGCLNCTCS